MRGPRRGWTRWAAAWGLGLALAGCSSVSLREPSPVVVATPVPVVTAPASAPATPSAAAPTPAPPTPPVATSSPVRSGPVLPPTPEVLPGPVVPPAIAARFPEPSTIFSTPAFEPGRTAYTTNDELHAILYGLQRSGADPAHGTQVAVLPLGESQSGLPIEALAFTRPAPLPPAAAASDAAAPSALPARRPSVLIVAGQHGDEPAGSEALIVIAQDLAAGRLDRILDRVDVYLLPRANPDGAALGQHGTADGSDLERDHLLLRTPEAQAEARLVRDIAPLVVLDLQEYAVDDGFEARFGGVQRYDALLDTATVANLRPFVARAAEEWFRAPLAAGLTSAGFSNDWYYTLAVDAADKTVAMGGIDAGIGRNALGLKNIASLLVATRGRGIGRTDLRRRVAVAVASVRSVLGNAAAHAADLVKLRQFVDRDVVAGACQGEVAIEAAPVASEHDLAMLDPLTGAIRHVTVSWLSALELRILKSRPRPCGYWLAASESDAVRRLRLLGVEVQQLDQGGEVRGETYQEIGRDAAPGGGAARLRVRTSPVLLDMPAGGYYVTLEQPFANLAVAALEPESPAGYAANGVISSVDAEARILDRPQMHTIALP